MYQIKITGDRLKSIYFLKEILMKNGKDPIDFIMTTGKGQLFKDKKEADKAIKVLKKFGKPYAYEAVKVEEE